MKETWYGFSKTGKYHLYTGKKKATDKAFKVVTINMFKQLKVIMILK